MAGEARGVMPGARATTSQRPRGSAHVASRALRWLALAAVWGLVGLVVGLAAAVTLPSAFGLKPLTILSGSMEPTLPTGGITVNETIVAGEARPGDIVTFTDPEDRGRMVTHRVSSIRIEDDKAYLVTRGDANDTVERWNTGLDAELGRVVYAIPLAGHVRSWISGHIVRLAVLGLIAALGLWMLIDIWRPRGAGADED